MPRPLNPTDETNYAGRFAARLRELRTRCGMTGQQAAEAITSAGYPVAWQTYFNWESARRDPPMDAMPAIAEAFGMKTTRGLFPPK